MKKDSEEKTKFSKLFPNNQTITASRIERRIQKMTMNEKLNMIGLSSCIHFDIQIHQLDFCVIQEVLVFTL